MKKAYFVHQDSNAAERQSDGVELCIIPELHDGKIYFYCSEYETFWKTVGDAGDFDKAANLSLKNEIRPATIVEICREGLCEYIDTIKEYETENGTLLNIKYIHFH